MNTQLSKRCAVATVAQVNTKQQRTGVVAQAKASPVKITGAAAVTLAAIAASEPAMAFQRIIPDGTVARMTPSLEAFLNSLVWGGVVLGLFFGAVSFIAYYDPIRKLD